MAVISGGRSAGTPTTSSTAYNPLSRTAPTSFAPATPAPAPINRTTLPGTPTTRVNTTAPTPVTSPVVSGGRAAGTQPTSVTQYNPLPTTSNPLSRTMSTATTPAISSTGTAPTIDPSQYTASRPPTGATSFTGSAPTIDPSQYTTSNPLANNSNVANLPGNYPLASGNLTSNNSSNSLTGLGAGEIASINKDLLDPSSLNSIDKANNPAAWANWPPSTTSTTPARQNLTSSSAVAGGRSATPTTTPTTTPSTATGSPGQYNPLTFKPLDVPNDQASLNSTMLNDPGTFYSDFQNVLNHDAVSQGNRAAQAAVDKYNGEMQAYLQNGGANNKYGLQAPTKPDLTQFYKPAMSSTSTYTPPTGNSLTGGTWMPGGLGSTAGPGVPQGVSTNSNIAPWTPPSGWTPNAQNTNYNPLNPNQGNTSATAYNTGGQNGLNAYNNPTNQQQLNNNTSAFTQYIQGVLGGNGASGNTQPSNTTPQQQQLNSLLQLLTNGAFQQPTTDIFGQYNPFGQFGGGLGNMGSSQLSGYGLNGLNNNSFYFPSFV